MTSKAVLCLHCWGWRAARQGQCRGEQWQGRGFLFYLTKLPNPFLCKESVVCVCCAQRGQAQAVVTQCQGFWATVCEEKTCIHLNCLIMLQGELSMLNGPQTSCVYFQACCSSHLTCSLFKCFSLLLPFLFSH